MVRVIRFFVMLALGVALVSGCSKGAPAGQGGAPAAQAGAEKGAQGGAGSQDAKGGQGAQAGGLGTSNAKLSAELAGQAQEAIKANPKDPRGYLLQGASHYMVNNYDEAIKSYQKALAIDPSNAEAITYIGNVYRDQRKLDEAEQMYRKAMALQPQWDKPYINLQGLMVAQQRYAEAVQVMETAVQKVKLSDVWIVLGSLYEQQKEPAKARNAYEQALKLAPGDTRAKAALDRLEKGS